MAANNSPIFTLVPITDFAKGVTAGTGQVTDVTGLTVNTNIFLIFTVGSADGGYLQKIRFRALSNTAATVARIWINNGLTLATLANTWLYDDITIPTLTLNTAAAFNNYELAVNIGLPANYRVYVTFSTAPGGSGFDVWGIGGEYS